MFEFKNLQKPISFWYGFVKQRWRGIVDDQVLFYVLIELLCKIWIKKEEKIRVQAVLFTSDRRQSAYFTTDRHRPSTAQLHGGKQLLHVAVANYCWLT